MSKLQIQYDCPHCGSLKASFNLVFYQELTKPLANNETKELLYNYITLWQCLVCKYGLTLNITTRMQITRFIELNMCLSYNIKDSFPTKQQSYLNRFLPEKIFRMFNEAYSNLNAQNNTSCVLMLRKIIETTAKYFECQGFNLQQNIIELLNKNIHVSNIRNWLEIVRIYGNEAAHDDKIFTDIEAKELFDFTELFLLVMFAKSKLLQSDN
jgi:hypothetical protein